MDDDWRLQIDLDDDGLVSDLADHLHSADLEHEMETDFGKRLIVSRDGGTVFLYAGEREQIEKARDAVAKLVAEKGWKADLDLRHWHEVAEDWEDPDAAEPTTAAEEKAERARLMKTEDEEVSAHDGYAEFEVRVEFPSHGEARDFAKKLKDEGLEPVRRWRYMVVGAADEDAAKELADRIREEAPADSKVTTEGSLAAAWHERPTNPFFFLGGLAG